MEHRLRKQVIQLKEAGSPKSHRCCLLAPQCFKRCFIKGISTSLKLLNPISTLLKYFFTHTIVWTSLEKSLEILNSPLNISSERTSYATTVTVAPMIWRQLHCLLTSIHDISSMTLKSSKPTKVIE
jgi:hypothetical protein